MIETLNKRRAFISYHIKIDIIFFYKLIMNHYFDPTSLSLNPYREVGLLIITVIKLFKPDSKMLLKSFMKFLNKNVNETK